LGMIKEDIEKLNHSIRLYKVVSKLEDTLYPFPEFLVINKRTIVLMNNIRKLINDKK